MIPYDRTIVKAQEKGLPVTVFSDSPAAKAITTIQEQL
jgi:septum formation inhibitor-activating ATPase MinD